MINPLWMIKLERKADLLYESLPCHKSSAWTFLNLRIEKSAARAACLPSFPTIPTPTSDAWIIPTSFPPSPIPKTADFYPFFLLFFTPEVNVLFCSGEHRQHITLGICIAWIKKSFALYLSSRTYVSVFPSIMRTLLRFCLTLSHLIFQAWGVVIY